MQANRGWENSNCKIFSFNFQNKYGNIEVFNGPLPEHTVYVDLPKVAMICRKLKIEHVPAVIGFEKGGNGKSHPCISGVVTFQHNLSLIENEHALMTS